MTLIEFNDALSRGTPVYIKNTGELINPQNGDNFTVQWVEDLTGEIFRGTLTRSDGITVRIIGFYHDNLSYLPFESEAAELLYGKK